MSEKQNEPAHTRELQLGSRARLRAFVLLALTVAGIYVCYLLLLPFLPGLVVGEMAPVTRNQRGTCAA